MKFDLYLYLSYRLTVVYIKLFSSQTKMMYLPFESVMTSWRLNATDLFTAIIVPLFLDGAQAWKI